MSYSGDEVYDGDITSGVYYCEILTDYERAGIISALVDEGFDPAYLVIMDDDELMSLADEYDI